jgi:hypothetical protein
LLFGYVAPLLEVHMTSAVPDSSFQVREQPAKRTNPEKMIFLNRLSSQAILIENI